MLSNNVKKIHADLQKETLQRAAFAGGIVVANYAKINIGKIFKDVHGARGLSKIIVSLVEATNSRAVVDVGPTVVYGRIHELGGWIKPIRAKLLHWIDKATGKDIFARAVYIPARPYLRPAMDDHEKEIEEAIVYQINLGIKRSCA